MDNYSIVYVIINSLARMTPALLVTAGCIIYLIKTKSIVSIILLICNVSSLLLETFNNIMLILLMKGIYNSNTYGNIQVKLGAVSLIISLAFGVCFILMALNTQAKKQTNS